MNPKRVLGFSLAVALLVCSYACEHAPTSKFVKASDSFNETKRDIDRIGLVADAVISRSPATNENYFSLEYSLNAASFMLDGAKEILADKGYAIDYAINPFVGAFLAFDSTTTKKASPAAVTRGGYKSKARKRQEEARTAAEESKEEQKPRGLPVKTTEDGEVLEIKPPLYSSKRLENDSIYAQALSDLITNASDLFSTFVVNDTVRNSLSIIRERTNERFLMLILANGISVSGAKSAAQGCMTGLVTSVATMGMVTVVAQELSALNTHVGLIDLEKESLIWKNSGRLEAGDPTDKKYYETKKWPRTYFYHFPTKMGK